MTGYPRFLFSLLAALMLIGGIDLVVLGSGAYAIVIGDLAIGCGIGFVIGVAGYRER